jgi:hypothetical protein
MKLSRILFLAACAACTTANLPAADVVRAEVGNVSPASFTLLYQLTEYAEVSLRFFISADGATESADQLRVEWYPLDTGAVDVPGGLYPERLRRHALQAAMRGRNIVLARVSNATPGTTYHAELALYDPDSGTDVPAGRLAVTTAARNAFVHDARQIVVDLSATGLDLNGTLVRLAHATAPYPLFAVVSDTGGSGRCYFDLSHLLRADGQENALFDAGEVFTLSLRGVAAESVNANIAFATATRVASATSVPFAVTAPDVVDFVFASIADQLTGIPFSITVRAVDALGNPVAAFTDQVVLSATTTAITGGGATPAFSAGVLAGHSVTLGQAGTHTLYAHWPEGNITGASEAFLVQSARQLSLTVDPPGAAVPTGAGWFAEGADAPISIAVPEGWRLVHWVGSGVAGPYATPTTVAMLADRVITAVLAPVDPEETYAMWTLRYFLRNTDDPLISGFDADPNANGIINLLEYAYGNDPLSPEAPRESPVLWHADGLPMMTYYRRVNNPMLYYMVETTTDPGGAWQEYLPQSEDIQIEPAGVGMEKVDVTLPLPNGDPLFYRLRVVLTE